MEKPVQRCSGKGKLIFETGEAAVSYWVDEFSLIGRVSHVEGHPDWHPIVASHTGPFTLLMDDGRKLKVFLHTLQGDFKGTGAFF
jgi:hypothetical protein